MSEAVSISTAHPFEDYLYAKKSVADNRILQDKVTAEEAKEEAESTKPFDVRSLTIYPEPLLTDEQVKQGGFILYIIGKWTYSNEQQLSVTDWLAV